MSVPQGRRKPSRFEAAHNFYQLRSEVTDLVFNRFGFSEKKYLRKIERYKETHASAENVDEVVQRYQDRYDAFIDWFILEESKKVIDILQRIQGEFTFGNSIYPSDTPAKVYEFVERRIHVDEAIAQCYVLKQEINYIITTLPVDMNRYEQFADKIDYQIALYKGVRAADNRFLKSPGPNRGKNAQKNQTTEPLAVLDTIADVNLSADMLMRSSAVSNPNIADSSCKTLTPTNIPTYQDIKTNQNISNQDVEVENAEQRTMMNPNIRQHVSNVKRNAPKTYSGPQVPNTSKMTDIKPAPPSVQKVPQGVIYPVLPGQAPVGSI